MLTRSSLLFPVPPFLPPSSPPQRSPNFLYTIISHFPSHSLTTLPPSPPPQSPLPPHESADVPQESSVYISKSNYMNTNTLTYVRTYIHTHRQSTVCVSASNYPGPPDHPFSPNLTTSRLVRVTETMKTVCARARELECVRVRESEAGERARDSAHAHERETVRTRARKNSIQNQSIYLSIYDLCICHLHIYTNVRT